MPGVWKNPQPSVSKYFDFTHNVPVPQPGPLFTDRSNVKQENVPEPSNEMDVDDDSDVSFDLSTKFFSFSFRREGSSYPADWLMSNILKKCEESGKEPNVAYFRHCLKKHI